MRLSRPYIPLRVRVRVAERQLLACNIPPWPSRLPVRERLRLALLELFGTDPVELHHRPALTNRIKTHIHGSFHRYEPDANDPDYLVYLPAADHDIETRVRGQHGDYSDLAKARKRKRVEKKKTRTFRYKWGKRKLRSRGFR